MNRRRLLVAGLVAAIGSGGAFGAAKREVRVGYLEFVKESDGEVLYREFVEGMQSRGYVEGRNLQLLRKSAGARAERLRTLAAELTAAKVDVMMAASTEAAKGAKFGAPRVATVFVISGDPVHEGLVGSLSRPQGQLTGLTSHGQDLTAKRMQILKDAFPGIRSIAIVGSNVSMSGVAIDEPARRLQLDVLRFPVNQSADYRDAAAAITRSAADAVLVVEDADAVTFLNAFTRLMMATRRPVMFNADVFVEGEGWGLMAYGVSLRKLYRRAAHVVARLLEGAKPSDLPVEQPAHYELVVNLRAAEEYAIVLPKDFLQRADRVIR